MRIEWYCGIMAVNVMKWRPQVIKCVCVIQKGDNEINTIKIQRKWNIRKFWVKTLN